MTNELDDSLRGILGESWDGMPAKAKEVARRVAFWYEGGTHHLTLDECDVVESIWNAARAELGDMAVELDSPCRRREITDVRFVMFYICKAMIPRLPKRHIPEVLGIHRDHASTIYALRKAKDLIEYDPRFRGIYYRFLKRISDYHAKKENA